MRTANVFARVVCGVEAYGIVASFVFDMSEVISDPSMMHNLTRVVNPRVRTRGWVGYGYDPGQKIGEWVHGFIPMTHPPLHG